MKKEIPNCPESEQIAALIDGKLADGPRREALSHVTSCPSCYETFSETARFVDQSSQAVARENPVRESQASRTNPVAAFFRGRFFKRAQWAVLTPTAAVLLVLILVGGNSTAKGWGHLKTAVNTSEQTRSSPTFPYWIFDPGPAAETDAATGRETETGGKPAPQFQLIQALSDFENAWIKNKRTWQGILVANLMLERYEEAHRVAQDEVPKRFADHPQIQVVASLSKFLYGLERKDKKLQQRGLEQMLGLQRGGSQMALYNLNIMYRQIGNEETAGRYEQMYREKYDKP